MDPKRDARAPVILVVDEEEILRTFIGRVLRMEGYGVLAASDGEMALQLGQGHAGPIDLLVTDMMMRVMTGKELAGRLCLLRPGLKVLYVSGYGGDLLLDQPLDGTVERWLRKPFAPAELIGAVRGLLAQ